MKLKFTPSFGRNIINKVKAFFRGAVYYSSFDDRRTVPSEFTKSFKVLDALMSGEKLTQWEMARITGSNRHSVRSLICQFRKRGYPIFNERIPNSRKTRYFIVKPTQTDVNVNNKVFISMPVPHGKFDMKVIK